MVIDAMSRKSPKTSVDKLTEQEQLTKEFEKLEVEVVLKTEGALLVTIIAQTSLLEEIKVNQLQDPFLRKVVEELFKGKQP